MACTSPAVGELSMKGCAGPGSGRARRLGGGGLRPFWRRPLRRRVYRLADGDRAVRGLEHFEEAA